MLDAQADGTKKLIAVEDGYGESTESWLAVLRDLKRRVMQAPLLAIGDGALGFWAAVGEVWPATRQQRDWVHRMANVLDKLPKRLQPAAKRVLREMMYAESRAEAEALVERFASAYAAKYPKAVASLTRDQETCTAILIFRPSSRFRTRAEAKMAIFDNIEAWDNPQGRHSAVDRVSPINYERRYYTAA